MLLMLAPTLTLRVWEAPLANQSEFSLHARDFETSETAVGQIQLV